MNDHYYSKRPASRFKIGKITININSSSFEFNTGSGVFSFGRMDKGSEVLIKNMVIEDGWDVLDLGCGWGLIGIYLKKKFPGTKVTMADINWRAVKLAALNCKLNNVDCNVFQSDVYNSIEGKFNTIILNPPQHAGKEICCKMIKFAPDHLKRNGLFQVVARHQKGGKSLEKKMREVFGNVKTLARQSGFRVYASEN